MGACRLCGVECAPGELLAVYEGGGCLHCNGSPACARCGHARRHHRGTFGSGRAGCRARVAADQGLAVGRCGCESYTTDASAFTESVEIVDLNTLRLRLPGEPLPAQPARLAPIRDLFHGGRRLRDIGESDGVPWRPPE